MSDLLKLANQFYKLAQPILQPDTSLIIQKALYSKFGNPPMTMINSVSDNAYQNGGSASLLVETISGNPVIKFESKNNPQLAKELNSLFINKNSKKKN